ncbi:hypothetical protein CFC21_005743 [Triticum aestivum]|uniref:F-box domain-containing protein n=2 Tax=Triticum aestivum TaxID=4565 RepID=A0A3B5YU90_WHEAT|nr:hypothetical protein CFC21_005743 [Triticum aestivum]
METETVVETLLELPLDVLMDIFSLLELPDLIRASSVCSFWRSAYSSLHSQLGQYKRPQTPCLLYASEADGENVASLYSLAEKRVYKLTLPDPPIRTRHLIGSSNGWLVTADEKSELHLFNPITGQQIALPSAITKKYISFARVGDYKWTSLPGKNYKQCIHMDGLLYAFAETGGVYAFDLTGPTIMSYIIADEMENYISGTDGDMGDLLQVCRKSDVTEELLVQTEKVLLYKADMAAKKLVEVNGLHDHVLFLGRSQSQCLSAEAYPQLKKNCVYFTDDEIYVSHYKNNRRDIGILNLGNDSTEEIVSQLWCNWPNPIWITPNLTSMNANS